MTSRILRLIVSGIFALHTFGCTVHSKKDIKKEDLRGPYESPTTGKTIDEKIIEVVFASGKTIVFDENGGTYVVEKRIIRGRTTLGEVVEIDIDDVLYARVETVDAGKSALKTLALTPVIILGAAVGLVVLSIPFSCPYIYSFDGKDYVFDAEPLGGSVCRGMERTDYSRLDHLRATGGKYRLIVQNETNETQYIDETALFVVDHPPGSRVVPGLDGSMHVVEDPVAPHRAVDERGADLAKFLEAPDGVAWQTELPKDGSYRERSLRHELVFEFAKPRGAVAAKLVINAGTALWGSSMIKEMLQLRGDKVDAWYESVSAGGPAARELIGFNVREELYFLRFYIKEGGVWRFRGWIPGGGPLVTEDRVIPVDLSGVTGDTVVMRVRPPMGFWTIDYLAIEFDDHPCPAIRELVMNDARDRDGENAGDVMVKKDDRRVVMPRVGDRIVVEFEAPPQVEGSDRTVFLKTTGYYEIHIDKTQPEQTSLIAEILANEGRIVEYSMNKYLSLYSGTLSRR